MIEQLTKQLRRDEGEVLHAYQDHLGFWTIGIGRLIDERKGGRISSVESANMLANDIADKMAELDRRLPWYRQLDPVRQGAIVNMAFQLGVDGLLGFTNTLGLIRQGRYPEASVQMLKSKWASQTPERALRMSKQIKEGTWQ
jgi:lysozyme